MKKQFIILYLNIFLVFLGIGLIIPVLPVYLKDLGLSGADLGILVAVFALAQMLISPFGGTLADRLGKKLIICIGLVLFSISEFLFAASHTFSLLIVSRILGGFSAGMIMPGVTGLIADLSPPKDKARNFGYMSAIISAGFILGPGIGGFLAEISHRLPFVFAGVLGVLAFICTLVFVQSPKHTTTQGFPQFDSTELGKINYKAFITPAILTLILAFGLSAFETLFPLYTADKMNFQPADISIAITGGGIFGAIFQVFLFDKMIRHMSELIFIIYALIYSAFVLMLLIFAHSYWHVMLICFIVFIGFDLIRPALTNYFSNIAGNRQGFAGGLNSTFTSMGNFIGPLIAGGLYDVNIEYPLYMSIIFMLLGCIVIMIERQLRRHQNLKQS
ncbi:multidrug efflux MFS transporter NorA [Staphylococcus intermedius]|uniref:Quinolone resistance protein NorA n=1 Tax=Staphylococcus intermedius NCTC 11048 TaxID=1141106 RepID=A0A380G9U8_STAIN|nr:multidrug efflux MFS transporter NorA [Staphylococcus intermedius]PCF65498.1 multidrug efflux MFS transporter NorA [Staphylococcus intermedius]PCF81176.1 multidrug efflux MFS transporter NorA [Staphylococcus intermedius]PCF82458.1 multidrug efflux MFS transporter NorA [Staphylococcus intermedius]PCF87158.1 multidrug efflux MFS transporter NorA [Staphylococcus intermedius]PCF87717.1 multidrug efflux MFS transporter NorA [Staphylococcus intermedius]